MLTNFTNEMKRFFDTILDFYRDYNVIFCIIVSLVIILIFILILALVLRGKKRTIRFILPNGVNGVEKIRRYKGHLVELPKASKDGYIFKGWYFDEDKTQEANFTVMPNANLVLYPSFEINANQVVLKPDYHVAVAVEAAPIFKPEDEVKPEVDDTNEMPNAENSDDVELDDEEEVLDQNGEIVKRAPSKSFIEKARASQDKTKDYIVELSNYILKYQKISYRITRKGIGFKYRGELLAKITMSGMLLKVFFALNLNDYDQNKYHFKDMSEKKSHLLTPLMLNLRSDRSVKYAKFFIDELVRIKELRLKRSAIQYTFESLILAMKNAPIVKAGLDDLLVDSVSADETSTLTDAQALDMLQVIEGVEPTNVALVTTEMLNEAFEQNDRVDLDKLKELELVPAECDGYRLHARGELTKALNVITNDISLNALKMVLLTGGIVTKIKTN